MSRIKSLFATSQIQYCIFNHALNNTEHTMTEHLSFVQSVYVFVQNTNVHECNCFVFASILAHKYYTIH